MIIILLWEGGGPMRGKHEDGIDSFCGNHNLHHCVNFKERPIKKESTQTSTYVLEWVFSQPKHLD